MTDTRAAIAVAYRTPEPICVPPLIEAARLPPDLAAPVRDLAASLVRQLRQERSQASGVDALMQEFSLSSQEGIALMCLAEALLRIPDTDNRDRLIRDKIGPADWRAHLGASPSLFVNAASWGLLLTGKLVATNSEGGLSAALSRLIARSGEPVIRAGVDFAMRMLGRQFVLGETIEKALDHGRPLEKRGFRYSFDMLGEAAMTAADADRYTDAYRKAIDAIGAANAGHGVYRASGISIKLSALHPRYTYAQPDRMTAEMLPRLRALAAQAMHYDIGLNIDAEEADRLDPSLDLLEALSADKALNGWAGLGFVIQAYQKRAPHVVAHVIDMAKRHQRRIMIRLVKGAYWDSEIKRAQVDGLEGFPVFTRKPYTDVSYLACAKHLLAERAAVFPQFATHNAQTLAAIYHLAGPDFAVGDWEFQCLHGMGESLYDQVVGANRLNRPCRIYAPVGSHQTLLAYLVRRLLENGANSSFVHRLVDHSVPIDALTTDPVEEAASYGGEPHPMIRLPGDLFAPERRNSTGLDLSNPLARARLEAAVTDSRTEKFTAASATTRTLPPRAVSNPADHTDSVGTVCDTAEDAIDSAMEAAARAAPGWAATPPAQRATILERAADLYESHSEKLIALAVREAGKTMANGIGEVREAVDFLRYYAVRTRADLEGRPHTPLGPIVCISPWNFPLAIFTGQIAAALAAGNPVLAKPAEQTPLIAAAAISLLHEAGIPADALQFLPGDGGTIGARLVADARTAGVMFTGSTDVARLIHRTLAARGNIPLIAETGGQNAMIVDSSALPEQVVNDVLTSAFDSAGQRCSALRVLCLQRDIADHVIEMLKGAMDELRIGDPARIETDIGPVIDTEAQSGLLAYLDRRRSQIIHQLSLPPACARGTFVPPTLIEIGGIEDLDGEVFGPVLHVLRFDRAALDKLIQSINATGYGLTLGVHSRIDETIDQVVAHAHAGNCYVNRNIVGAVVGVQPFGGEGLSGTGPKAGGPLYLHRLLRDAPALPASDGPPPAPLNTLLTWLETGANALLDPAEAARLARDLAAAAQTSPLSLTLTFPGPVGETNSLRFAPRGPVLGLATDAAGMLLQFGLALATGNDAVLPDTPPARAIQAALPPPLHGHLAIATNWRRAAFRAVLVEGSNPDTGLITELAARPGPLLPVISTATLPDLSQLLVERTLSVNETAAGGNAHLMTL